MLSKLALDSGSSLEDLRVSEYEETLLKRTLYVLRDRKIERFFVSVCLCEWFQRIEERRNACYVLMCVSVAYMLDSV